MRNFKLLSVLLLCMAVVFTSCGTLPFNAALAACLALALTPLASLASSLPEDAGPN